MGIRENLKAFKIGLGIAKAGLQSGDQGITASLRNLLTPKWNEPPARNTYQILDMYSKNPRMNPVRKISEDVGGARFKLYTSQDKEKALDSHPLLDLLNNPNPMPEFTGYTIRYLTEIYMLLKGQAYWVLERNGLGQPTEIWLVPPHWVRQTPSFYKPFYMIQPMGVSTLGVKNVPMEDVIHFKDPNPLDPYARGIGQAEGIGDEIETDEYMAKYEKRFFYNDATPPFAVTAPGAQEEEIDRMEERWMSKHAGANNSHKPAFFNWDAQIQILKETNREMEYIESRKFLRDLCNQHFNIPPEILGISENSNRATIESAYYIYAKNVLTTKFRLIEDTINTQLCVMFKDNPYFEFENIIPDDKEFNLEVANAGLTNGTILVDEWRKINGLDALPNGQGQVLMVKIGTQPTKPEDLEGFEAIKPVQQTATNTEPQPTKSVITKEDKKTIQKYIKKNNQTRIQQRDKLSKPLEKSFEYTIKKYLSDMKDEAVSKIKSGSHDPIDLDKWNAKIKEVLAPEYQRIFKTGGDAVIREFKTIGYHINKKIDVFFDYKDPSVTQKIKDKVNKITKVNETTKENVKQKIAEMYEDEENDNFTIGDIADAIGDMPEFDDDRAQTIAQTEVLSSLNQATMEGYKQNSDLIDGKAWLSNNDAQTRPAHLQAGMDYDEANAIPVDEDFIVDGEECSCPGDDTLSAGNAINCRCTIMPIVSID
ncbi:phage portal protein [Clostridium felsineum]|uniref:phage portal protein n=1 Tax=Clostridium felsineum TaxID=36839 RepID=UPI00214D256F|nr:phage portal protein [Clostridium felsineum]MCR3759170.1 phage portal protein [Clostridium felsineum]